MCSASRGGIARRHLRPYAGQGVRIPHLAKCVYDLASLKQVSRQALC